MKKLAAMVTGGLLLCGGAGVATADSRCEPFQGTLKLNLPTATTCNDFKAVRRAERAFEDAVFLFEVLPETTQGLCFSGVISDVMLEGRKVEASSLSAFTVNQLPSPPAMCGSDPCPPMFTAATVVTVTANRDPRNDKELGQIFLRDTGVVLPGTPIDGLPPFVTSFVVEQLIGVGGTKKFSKASVSMEIVGTEFLPSGADVKGTICR